MIASVAGARKGQDRHGLGAKLARTAAQPRRPNLFHPIPRSRQQLCWGMGLPFSYPGTVAPERSFSMTDIGASVPDRALVSDQAPTGLDPSGFDPSRKIGDN